MLTAVRSELQRRGLTALLVTSSDAHNSEYVAPSFTRRAALCGFHGSAGSCLVTQDKAMLWTDGRYWAEATSTLHPGWELMKDRRGDPANVTIEKWIAANLGADAVVGVDATTVTETAWGQLAKEVRIEATEGNVVDSAAAATAHPLAQHLGRAPRDAVEVFPDEFAGSASVAKLAAVADAIRARRGHLTIVTALDDIAWLFNLRGSDVPYNSVFYAFAIVFGDLSRAPALFIDAGKLTEDVRKHLPPGTEICPYDGVSAYLEGIARGVVVDGAAIAACVDPSQANHDIYLSLQRHGVKPINGPSIVQAMKGTKNDVELAGFRAAHVRDGVALTRFLAWLDDRIRSGHAETDVSACAKLESLRREMPLFRRLSFETIAGSGPNGAIIHRRCDEAAPAPIDPKALFLLDSGAHYLDGTTDVTRTVTFADEAARREVEAYTLVLKGHIALNTIVFPARLQGVRIDAMARQHLWRFGLDYAHGTGHGVGHCLAVHEGPFGIGTQPTATGAGLEKRCVVSNEPGYYLDGAFGIRIENLEEVVEAQTTYGKPEEFLTMRSLTVVPLCRELICPTMLTADETAWINQYNARVASELRAVLEKRVHELDDLALRYVEKHCARLP